MDVLASAPAPTGGEPPWLAITLAAIAVLGPVGVAYMPVLQARLQARQAAGSAQGSGGSHEAAPASPPPPPLSPPPVAASENIALIREVMADALAQRDAANARAEKAEDELTEARIHIARLEARGRYGP